YLVAARPDAATAFERDCSKPYAARPRRDLNYAAGGDVWDSAEGVSVLFSALGVEGVWKGAGKSPSRTFLVRYWREKVILFPCSASCVSTRRGPLPIACSASAHASRQSRPSAQAFKYASTMCSNQKLIAIAASNSGTRLRRVEASRRVTEVT